ncbi:MAG: hypothetical protein II878_06020 [Bacteroidales bacterium]|nr:hypothetical protein [Bacteroidales bacterium]
MKISRKNYEAFLLDRQENTLSVEEEQELEDFFKDNADLISEQECDASFRLKDFPNDVLPNKEKLFKKNNTLYVLLKYSAVAAVLLFVCTYLIVIYNTDNNKTNTFTKTLNIKQTAPKSNIENINNESNPLQPVVKNISTKEKEKVFDTLFLVRGNEDTTNKEQTLENKLYYEYIDIAYSDNLNEGNVIRTNKILTYEKNN